MEGEITCIYAKFGKCKKEDCNFHHPTDICCDKTCKIHLCSKKHPRHCRYFWGFDSCRNGESCTGCLYKLSQINLVWWSLKCTKSNFNPVYVFPHFKSFCLVVLQLILSLKLSELEQFEKQAENCLFADKIEFFGKWLHPRAKLKKTDPT